MDLARNQLDIVFWTPELCLVCLDFETHGFWDIFVGPLGFLELERYELLGFWTLGHRHFGTWRFLRFWTSGLLHFDFVDFGTFELLGVWILCL